MWGSALELFGDDVRLCVCACVAPGDDGDDRDLIALVVEERRRAHLKRKLVRHREPDAVADIEDVIPLPRALPVLVRRLGAYAGFDPVRRLDGREGLQDGLAGIDALADAESQASVVFDLIDLAVDGHGCQDAASHQVDVGLRGTCKTRKRCMRAVG